MMIRYIPDFIFKQYEKQQLAGSFHGYALLFDIADFTPISTEFQKHGKEGAEELSKFLDFAFGEPIRIVEACGGFVSLFAGDAFCAIFPDGESEGIKTDGNKHVKPILAAALNIRDFFQGKSSYQSALGEFHLQIRQTVSHGEIHWQIFENELQNEYVFSGQPMRDLAELSALKEELVFSGAAVEKLGLEGFERKEHGGFVLSTKDRSFRATVSELSEALSSTSGSSTAHAHQQHPTATNRFLNPKYHDAQPEPEIRSAAFCFANLDQVEPDKREQAIADIQHLADKYGGFVNKYDATDKGLVALILFGLPRSEGKTLERICNFALEALDAIPCLALGISCGSVFSGFTGSKEIKEYTALGAPVNLAARLMSKARAGEVLTDSFLWQELHSAYDFGYLGSLSLKGIEQAIRYYRLKRLAQHSQREEHRFVGRDEELSRIRDYINQTIEKRENLVLYVNGDAGIGKSRLVSEALASYSSASPEPGKSCHKYFISCDAILHKPLEAIKQILRSHFYYNSALPIEAAIPMFRALWSQIDPTDSEMQRIESFLASLLGYEWQGSIWSMLPPEERPQQLKNAFVYFIRKLSQSKPILILLDDGQWLDEESRSYFQALSEAKISPLIIVSPCRYLEDGSKAELELAKHKRLDLDLDFLGRNGCNELVKSILRLHSTPKDTEGLIFGRSMGNPLFIEQLSSYLLETGSINDKGEIIKELGYLSSFSISDIVSSRIDRLTDKVKECLFSASVLGMEFNIKVLSQMLKTDLTQELEAGTNSRIWKDLDELRYIFSHILIKDIVYQRMMSDKLKDLHRLAAESMESLYGKSVSEYSHAIAYHFEKAAIYDKAISHYTLAGNQYHESYLLVQADLCLKAALHLSYSIHAELSEEIAELHQHLFSLQLDQGDYVDAEASAQSATEIMQQLFGMSDARTAFALQALGVAKRHRGHMTDAKTILLEVLDIREQLSGTDSLETAMAIANLIPSLLYSGENTRAEDYGRRMFEVIDQMADIDPISKSFAIYRYGESLIGTGKLEEAEIILQRAISIIDNHFVDHPVVCRMLHSLAILYQCHKEYTLAESQVNRALCIYQKYFGSNSVNAIGIYDELAALCNSQKEYQKAIAASRIVMEIAEKAQIKEHPIYTLAKFRMAYAHHMMDQFTTAETMYLESLTFYINTSGVKHRITQWNIRMICDLYERMNQPEKAAHYKAMLLPKDKAPE